MPQTCAQNSTTPLICTFYNSFKINGHTAASSLLSTIFFFCLGITSSFISQWCRANCVHELLTPGEVCGKEHTLRPRRRGSVLWSLICSPHFPPALWVRHKSINAPLWVLSVDLSSLQKWSSECDRPRADILLQCTAKQLYSTKEQWWLTRPLVTFFFTISFFLY